MSHHFDSPESRDDSRINITDIYLFHTSDPVKVVAIMNISPLAGVPSPFIGTLQATTFRPETGYEFRFDTNGGAKPDVIFRFLSQGETTSQRWTLH